MAYKILILLILITYVKHSESVYFYHIDHGLKGLEINDEDWNADYDVVGDDLQHHLSARYFNEIINRQKFLVDNNLHLMAASYDPISKEALLVLGNPWYDREDQNGFVWLAKSKLYGKEHGNMEMLIREMPMNATVPGEYKARVTIGSPTSKSSATQYLKQFAYYNSTIYLASRTFFFYEDGSKKIKIELRTIDPSCDDDITTETNHDIFTCSRVIGTIIEGVPSTIPEHRKEFYDEHPEFSYNSVEYVITNLNLKPEIDAETGELMFFLHIYNNPTSGRTDLWKVTINGDTALLSVVTNTDTIPDLTEVLDYYDGHLCWSESNDLNCGKLIEDNTRIIDEWKVFGIPDDLVLMCNIKDDKLTELRANMSGIASVLDRLLILNMTDNYADIVFNCNSHIELSDKVYYPVNRLRLDKLTGTKKIDRLEAIRLHEKTPFTISFDFMVDKGDLASGSPRNINTCILWTLTFGLLVVHFM